MAPQASSKIIESSDDTQLLVGLFSLDENQVRYRNRISEKKRSKIDRKVKASTNGSFATAPIICKGYDKCPFKSHCPIPEVSDSGAINPGPPEDYPIGSSCILESSYIQQKTIEYIQYLNVDIRNPVEMSLVSELALIDLYKTRAQMILSSGDTESQGMDFLRIDQSAIDNGNGEDRMILSSTTQIHPVFTAMDTLEKRRDRLLSQLVETRKSKAEMAIKMGKRRDESLMMQDMRKMRQLLEAQNLKLPSESEKVLIIKD